MQGMSNGALDPRWPKLMSLAVHEFRTPMTVVAGYIRMLLKDRAGPVTDQQRRLLEEAEKSCGRLSALLTEMSDLSGLEAGTAPFNRSDVDLPTLLGEATASLPPMPDREITVNLAVATSEPMTAQADAVRLKTAIMAVLGALRRELVTTTELHLRASLREWDGRRVAWLACGDRERIEAFSAAGPADVVTFDEWRGGCGLSLAVARRIIDAHGGSIWSPADGTKAGAMVAIPVR
jgi:signal transduction histidine kinase